MTAQHYASLVAAIQGWLDKTQGVDDLDVVIGNDTVDHMATAARCVFEACEESQDYGKREELFK
jgi:hypothetical protein